MLQVFTVHLGSVPTVVIADTAILKDLLARFVIITFFIHSLILIAEKFQPSPPTHPHPPSSSHADADGQEGGGRESSSLSHPWDYAGGIWENSHRIHNFSIWLCFKYIKWLTSLEQGSNLQKMKMKRFPLEIVDIQGLGLICSEGDHWKEQRRWIGQALRCHQLWWLSSDENTFEHLWKHTWLNHLVLWIKVISSQTGGGDRSWTWCSAGSNHGGAADWAEKCRWADKSWTDAWSCGMVINSSILIEINS